MRNSKDKNTDIVLMFKVKGGDHNAFRLLCEKYKRKIINFFRYRHNPYLHLSAEDYTQEVLLRLWEAREGYNPQRKKKFSSYLLSIAANLWIDYCRKAKNEPLTVSLNAPRHPNNDNSEPLEAEIADKKAIDPAEALLKKELEARIEEAINSLPKEQREVYLLTREGLSYKDISRIVDCPVKTVSSRRARAVKKLKELLLVSKAQE